MAHHKPDGAEDFEGFKLRRFDPVAGVWRIWWASSRSAGLWRAQAPPGRPVKHRRIGGHGPLGAGVRRGRRRDVSHQLNHECDSGGERCSPEALTGPAPAAWDTRR
ncbi:hypothetical protein GCM10010199_27120 [Dactylosporangium roseum]